MTAPATSAAPAGPTAMSPEQFLRFFPGHWIQYFDDGLAKDRRKAMATPDFDPKEATRKQKVGCGVFFSPNAFDGTRRIENLRHVQAVYVDIDLRHEGDGTPEEELNKRLESGLAGLRGFAFPPHAIIRTKNGLQAVWRVEPLPPAEGLDLFRRAQHLLVAHFGADPAAKDVTRVLRLPGFLHLKNAASPFSCDILHSRLEEKPYRLSDFVQALTAATPSRSPVTDSAIGALKEGQKWSALLGGVPQGERNGAAARVAGGLLAGQPVELWETAGWGGLKEWNDRNIPPLPERELRSVFDSITGRERAKRQSRVVPDGGSREPDRALMAQADRLVGLATDHDAVFFCDQFGEPHAHVAAGAGRRTIKVRGTEFREWLARGLWEAEGRACASKALNAAVDALAGRTRFGGKRLPLECRVAPHEGAIWYDLADDTGRAVRVSPEGWAVVERPPVLFRSFNHQLPQPVPVRGRPLSALLPLVNLADPRRGPLLLVYLVTCFVPDIPHPIALVCGPQGATKSTLCRLLRRLIDPSSLEGLALPPRDEFSQLLFHHWFPTFDNVSAISPDVSDLLCRAVTGEGFSRRKLYTDDEDVIYHFRRCLCLNSIGLAVTRLDFHDRCILFPMERLPEERRRGERAVLQEFEALRPELLGAIFDALAKAMQLRQSLAPAALPRMADFALWGVAVAEGLGIGADAFLALYRENIREQHEEAVADNPVAAAVAELMTSRREWCGTATELLRNLEDLLADGGPRANRGLPKNATILAKQLNLMKTPLAQLGIIVDSSRRTSRKRLIHLRRVAAPGFVSGPAPSGDGKEETHDGGARVPASPVAAQSPASGDGSDAGDGRPAAPHSPRA
jgi:hypothetical protein